MLKDVCISKQLSNNSNSNFVFVEWKVHSLSLASNLWSITIMCPKWALLSARYSYQQTNTFFLLLHHFIVFYSTQTPSFIFCLLYMRTYLQCWILELLVLDNCCHGGLAPSSIIVIDQYYLLPAVCCLPLTLSQLKPVASLNHGNPSLFSLLSLSSQLSPLYFDILMRLFVSLCCLIMEEVGNTW